MELFQGEIYFSSLLYCIVFFLLAYFFSKINLKIPDLKQLKLLGLLFNNKVELIFIIIFFISSTIFFFKYGLEFRQTGDNLSSGGSILYLNYISKAYIKCFLLKQIIFLKNKKFKTSLFKLILILFASILSTAAALDVLISVVVIVLIFKKELIYANSNQSISFYFLLTFIIVSVPAIGTANKIGFENTYILFTENYDFVIKTIFRRIATWFHSVNIYLGIVFNEIIPNAFDLVVNIFKTSINRIAILFGYERDVPEINTAARFNYLNLFLDNKNPRTGATSGIVATSILFFPFGLLIFSFLMGKFYKYVYDLIPEKTSYFTDFIILMVIILPVVSSPLDLIIIVSPEIFFLIFLISLKFYTKGYLK
tara:strand:+ start:1 stop:1101 length:1101 start_codon:yes stop_codon:yes gene_type:complete